MKYYTGDVVEIASAEYISRQEMIRAGSFGYYQQNNLPAPVVGQRFVVSNVIPIDPWGYGAYSYSLSYHNGVNGWSVHDSDVFLYHRPLKNLLKQLFRLRPK